MWRVLWNLVSHHLQKFLLLLLLVLLVHTARSDVIKVLKPLEVGTSYTTTVGKHVWYNDDASFVQVLLSGKCCWAVSTLNNDLALQVFYVVLVDSLFSSCWQKDIALELHKFSWVKLCLLYSTLESLQGSLGDHMVLGLVNIDTIWIINGRVIFNYTNNLGAVLFTELGGPVAHSTKTLDNHGLASQASGCEVRLFDEAFSIQELLKAVVNTETSGFGTAIDTTLGKKLTSTTTFSINISLTMHVNVGIFDPGHDLLVGTHVWAEAIDLWSNKTFLGEFHSVPSGDLLELSLRIFLWVNLNTTFGATEWHISDRELESHKGCKSHNFLKIHVWCVSSTTLDWQFVMLVLSTITQNLFHVTIVASDWDSKTNHIVTDLNHVQVVLWHISLGGSSIEEQLDLL